jgi:hypothetical protein
MQAQEETEVEEIEMIVERPKEVEEIIEEEVKVKEEIKGEEKVNVMAAAEGMIEEMIEEMTEEEISEEEKIVVVIEDEVEIIVMETEEEGKMIANNMKVVKTKQVMNMKQAKTLKTPIYMKVEEEENDLIIIS